MNEFLNYWVWHILAWGVPVAAGVLLALNFLEIRQLYRLHRAINAVEQLAVLSFLNVHRPVWEAWVRSMGEMQVDVRTRGFSFSFDPTEPHRKQQTDD